MKRHHVTLGTKTTAGGEVISAGSMRSVNSVKLALEGDKIYCPGCKSEGLIRCHGPRLTETWSGINFALEHDLCICKCKRPPTLLAGQLFSSQTVGGGGVGSDIGKAWAGQLTEESPEQQVRAIDAKTGSPIPDLAYYIEAPDGMTYAGHTDAQRLCERVRTYEPAELTVWFGEDAAKKGQAAQ